MKFHRGFCGALLLSCLLAAAWTVRVHSAAGRQTVIKFAYLGATNDARHRSAQKFKEWVESDPSAAFTVELYPGGQLGGDRDAIEGVKLGTLELTVAGAGIFANFEPAMGVTALPYLFDSAEEAWAFDDSALNARISARLQPQGIRVLGHWSNGFRCVTNSVRPIHSPADLNGLKIRTPENPPVLATMSALGADPSPLPWTELYMALQQGAFDGQENPIPTIYVNRLYETQAYLAITNHVYEPMPLVISEQFWDRLTGAEQKLIAAAARRSQEYNRQLMRTMTSQALIELERLGMQITYPELGAFRDRTANVRQEFRDLIGEEVIDQAYAFGERPFPESR